MPRLNDLRGQKFNQFTVLYRVKSDRKGTSHWMCQCECGTEKVVSSDHLTRKTQPVKSCGCLQRNKMTGSNHPQWTGVGDISGSWWSTRIERELFGRSRRHNLLLDLTKEQAWQLYLDQGGKCALSGLSIKISATGTASLDRIDSSIGYTLSNVQWVHKDINFMKRTYSQEYFIMMCRSVADHSGGVCELPRQWAEADKV